MMEAMVGVGGKKYYTQDDLNLVTVSETDVTLYLPSGVTWGDVKSLFIRGTFNTGGEWDGIVRFDPSTNKFYGYSYASGCGRLSLPYALPTSGNSCRTWADIQGYTDYGSHFALDVDNIMHYAYWKTISEAVLILK